MPDPTPNTPQPQPGPSPTPTPMPCAVIPIGSIDKVTGGANITPASEWLTPFFVTDEYLETCNPESGGLFVQFDDVVCFMSATAFNAAYG